MRIFDRYIERPPEWFRRLMPEGLYRMPVSAGDGRAVWLTFDDGPVPEVTPWVLDTLDRYDAKATFFMVGENAARHPDLLESVRRRGHSVGNHTYHHLRGRGVSTEDYLRDVEAADSVVRSRLFRPPHGWLGRPARRILSERYQLVMYDVVTRDYSNRLSGADVVEVVRRLSRDGSIIVFHDSLRSAPRLRTALPASLEWLRGEGYEFKTF